MDVELRFIGGGSLKYYRVTTTQKNGQFEAKAEYGRIVPHQIQTNVLYTGADESQAEGAASEQIRKKLAKGYKIYIQDGLIRDPNLRVHGE